MSWFESTKNYNCWVRKNQKYRGLSRKLTIPWNPHYFWNWNKIVTDCQQPSSLIRLNIKQTLTILTQACFFSILPRFANGNSIFTFWGRKTFDNSTVLGFHISYSYPSSLSYFLILSVIQPHLYLFQLLWYNLPNCLLKFFDTLLFKGGA